MGRPNVGKSTLINAYVGQKVSIVSPKPQTTRRRVLGILTLDDAQVILVDTPGIHSPVHKLGEAMVRAAVQAIPDGDAILWLVDGSGPPNREDRQIAELVTQEGKGIPLVLGLNKSDLVAEDDRASRAQTYLDLIQPTRWMYVSAAQGENRDALLQVLIALLPLGPRFYPDDQVTDQTERAIAGELIREQVLLHTRQEVPYAVEVMVEDFVPRSEKLVYIRATVIVERSSQKGILLGQGGGMIKSISQAARRGIEAMVEKQVYLELWVKVHPNWRQSRSELGYMGFQ